MKEITIYTDGACSGNPGPGGWGAVLLYKDHQKEISGFQPNTTNNQMELLAALNALESLQEVCIVNLYTDSKYLKEGITKWIYNWKKNNWKNAKKQPVKNSEIWQNIDIQNQRHQINWHWVKAHNGDKFNELADQLAVNAIKDNNT
ncbi:MAG: ribonuclease HI [Pseudomonadota bacterium]